MSKFLKIYENTQDYIKTGIINEWRSFGTEDDYKEVIIKDGEELYHGTPEDFDKNKAMPGGYDDIFWVVYGKHYPKDAKNIALTYIPKHGLTIYTSTEGILKPDIHGPNAIQKSLGIDYDVLETDKSHVTSIKWKTDWISKIESKEIELYHSMTSIGNEFIKIKTDFNDKIQDLKTKSKLLVKQLDAVKYEELDSKENSKIFDEFNDIEITIAKMQKEFRKHEKEYDESVHDNYSKRREFKTELNTIVNNKLIDMKYEPRDKSNNNGDWEWKLIIKDKNQLAEGDYSETGRLLILTPTRPLKIKDISVGHEGDLTELEYHNHAGFEKAKKEGYDGIMINDFAQHYKQGNVGHKSIGLFKSTLESVKIEEELDKTHPDEI